MRRRRHRGGGPVSAAAQELGLGPGARLVDRGLRPGPQAPVRAGVGGPDEHVGVAAPFHEHPGARRVRGAGHHGDPVPAVLRDPGAQDPGLPAGGVRLGQDALDPVGGRAQAAVVGRVGLAGVGVDRGRGQQHGGDAGVHDGERLLDPGLHRTDDVGRVHRCHLVDPRVDHHVETDGHPRHQRREDGRDQGRQPGPHPATCTPGAYLGTRKETLVPSPGAVSTTRPWSSP
ncbi:hypothetical protein [Ornithinimicrobium kibberense]|uniref:hypothetical protein n=1 Tax=Ornithinimicrobium kibberense TaxID=282060 RepID=UPI0036093A58